jgi:hypothetical protein
MQKEKGKKAMLIKVNSITFWPNLVAARLSITLLALNSLLFISRMYFELLRALLTPFRSSVTSPSFLLRFADIIFNLS